MLELAEASFDDVPASVAGPLLIAEVDRTPGLLPAVGDLIVAFGASVPGIWRRMVAGGVYYMLPNLFFLAFAFMPFVIGRGTPGQLAWTVVGVVVISVVYVATSIAVAWPVAGRAAWLLLVAASLGILVPSLGIDVLNFTIYPAMAAAVLLPTRAAIPVVVIGAGAAALASGLAGAFTPVLLSIFALVGGVALALGLVIFDRNARLRTAEQRVATLAVAAERERIGRDLHDILGHSLTAIAVKAQLARRLVGQDGPRAAAELTELEDIARRALADVRATSSGMQTVRVATEVASARSVLLAAGVQPVTPSAMPGLDDDRATLFGYVVREAVTNVVRHARATSCTIVVEQDAVTVTDDGVGGADRAGGTGLTGLAERAAQAGMALDVRSYHRGTSVRMASAR